MNEYIEKLIALLPSLREALDLLETLLMIILAKKVSNVSRNTAPIVETVSTSKTSKSKKDTLATEFQEGLAVYFSGKSESAMTSEELAKYNLVKKYIEEVKNGNV